MSLTFGGATSDRVNHGAGSSHANLNPFTVWVWCYPTTLTGNKRLIGKVGGASFAGWDMLLGNSGAFGFELTRTTTLAYTSNATQITINAWWFVAATLDLTASPPCKLYVGSLGTPVAEVSGYATSTAASGAQKDDSANALIVGNLPGATTAFQGKIAEAGVVSRVLTLGEMRSLQYRPRNMPNTVFFTHVGFNGTSTQADLSGNANNGTVTGASLGDGSHVPISL